jgi:hypothetical protein
MPSSRRMRVRAGTRLSTRSRLLLVRCDTVVRIAGAPAFHRGSLMLGVDLPDCGQRFAKRRLDACVFPGETRVPATAPGSTETEEDSP